MSEHEPYWERREQRRQQEAAAAQSLLNQVVAHLDGIRSAMVSAPEGDVMYAGVLKLSPGGTARLSFKTPFAAVMVLNSTAAAVTVAADAGDSAPSVGAGVARIPAASFRLVSLRANDLVVFGTPTASVDIEVFLRHRQPVAGAWG